MSTTPTSQDLGEAAALTGVVVASGTRQDERQSGLDAAAIITKMAVTSARRMCNQHGCDASSETPCIHPEHRRDVDYLAHVLDVLGLPGDYQEVTSTDRQLLLTALASQTDESLGSGETEG